MASYTKTVTQGITIGHTNQKAIGLHRTQGITIGHSNQKAIGLHRTQGITIGHSQNMTGGVVRHAFWVAYYNSDTEDGGPPLGAAEFLVSYTLDGQAPAYAVESWDATLRRD